MIQKVNLFCATIVMLLAFSVRVFGQDYDYGAYGLFPQGSSRAMGMGGAYTAVSNDIGGIIYNPAGLAFGEWVTDFGGTHNKIDNREYDVTGEGEGFGIPYSFIFYGGAFHWGTWVIGAGVNSPYSMELKQKTDFLDKIQKLDISSVDVVLAKSFGKKFSLGVTVHQEVVKLKYKHQDTFSFAEQETEVKGNFVSYGAAFRDKKIGIGISVYPGRNYDVDESLNTGLPLSKVWFRDVAIPTRTSIGISYQLKSELLVAIDLDRYDGLPDTIFPGTGDDGDLTAEKMVNKGQQVLHGGFEWYLSRSGQNEVIWRMGAYNEPSRFKNGKDRTHFTMGLQVRFGPAILSVAYDNAKNFKNTSAGFSLSFGKI